MNEAEARLYRIHAMLHANGYLRREQSLREKVLGDASLWAWVLMPDHVHCLAQLEERESLDRLIKRVKSSSARHAKRILNRRGALWQAAYHDHARRSHEDFRTAARYVVANPLRVGLVEHLADYPFWDAAWL